MAPPAIEEVIPLIYHEKQEQGSMLCAQHALNALLQEHIFTATNLSEIAQSLDDLETAFDDERGHGSTNMDDTGFFSIQVLERALDVWGFSLPRWRGEAMRAYHDHPEDQLAFILNLQQHWFTLRRFGARDPADGASHWFNLNSFLEQPQWISDTYLGMVLHQAESEGYSIFAVVPKDPSAPSPLAETDVDRFAARCAPPSSAHAPANATSRTHVPSAPPVRAPGAVLEGLEDEDYELQAAIAASMGTEYYAELPELPPAPAPAPAMLPSFPGAFPPPAAAEDTEMHEPSDSDDELDPVEASRRRGARLLAQFQREQGMATRELGLDDFRARRAREEEEEAAQLARAIAESEALARAEGHAPLDDDDDDVLGSTSAVGGVRSAAATGGSGSPGGFTPAPAQPAHRVYDDEDAELQAALRASLEDTPSDFAMPDTPPPTRPAPPPALPPAPVSAPAPAQNEKAAEEDEEAEEHVPSKEIDLAEMRRARLARFGGGT